MFDDVTAIPGARPRMTSSPGFPRGLGLPGDPRKRKRGRSLAMILGNTREGIDHVFDNFFQFSLIYFISCECIGLYSIQTYAANISAQHMINFVVIPLSCYTKFILNLTILECLHFITGSPRCRWGVWEGARGYGRGPRRGFSEQVYMCGDIGYEKT